MIKLLKYIIAFFFILWTIAIALIVFLIEWDWQECDTFVADVVNALKDWTE